MTKHSALLGAGVVAALQLGWLESAAAQAPSPSSVQPAPSVPTVQEGHGVSASDSQEYREIVDEALKEYGLGHYEEARTLFLRAHALQPSARTHRGIGLAEYELRNYAECITQLEAALASAERPLTGQVRASTEEVLRRASRYVARVFVHLTPAEAKLVVDRVPVSIAPSQPLVLRVGEHLIEARADGYVPAARTLTVLGGADMQLDLALAQLSSEPAGVAVPSVMVASERGPLTAGQGAPHADDGGRHWYKNPWLWTAVGVVVVGAGVGTGVALAHRGGGTSAAYGGSTGQVGSGP